MGPVLAGAPSCPSLKSRIIRPSELWPRLRYKLQVRVKLYASWTCVSESDIHNANKQMIANHVQSMVTVMVTKLLTWFCFIYWRLEFTFTWSLLKYVVHAIYINGHLVSLYFISFLLLFILVFHVVLIYLLISSVVLLLFLSINLSYRILYFYICSNSISCKGFWIVNGHDRWVTLIRSIWKAVKVNNS